MTDELTLLLTDLRGTAALSTLRAMLTAHSLASLCQQGARVVLAGEGATPPVLEILRRQAEENGVPVDGGDEEGDEPLALRVAELLPGRALVLGHGEEWRTWADRPDITLLCDAISLAGELDGPAAVRWRAGPTVVQEVAVATRLQQAGRLGVVVGDPPDDELVDLGRWAIPRAALVCLGGAAGLLWARKVSEVAGAGKRLLDLLSDARQALIMGPEDVVVRSPVGELQTVSLAEAASGWRVVDIGPQTGMRWASALRSCDALLWRGAMGEWGTPASALGTRWVGEAQAGHLEGFRVAVGDETVAIAERFSLTHRLSWVSPSGPMFGQLLRLPDLAHPDAALQALRSGKP